MFAVHIADERHHFNIQTLFLHIHLANTKQPDSMGILLISN